MSKKLRSANAYKALTKPPALSVIIKDATVNFTMRKPAPVREETWCEAVKAVGIQSAAWLLGGAALCVWLSTVIVVTVVLVIYELPVALNVGRSVFGKGMP